MSYSPKFRDGYSYSFKDITYDNPSDNPKIVNFLKESSHVIFSNTTDITKTGTRQTAYSFTIPANYLKSGDAIRLNALSNISFSANSKSLFISITHNGWTNDIDYYTTTNNTYGSIRLSRLLVLSETTLESWYNIASFDYVYAGTSAPSIYSVNLTLPMTISFQTSCVATESVTLMYAHGELVRKPSYLSIS